MNNDSRLLDLIVEWEDRRAAGQPVTPEELCRDCPDCLEALRQRLQELESMQQAFAPEPGRTVTLHPHVTPSSTAAQPAGNERVPQIPGYEIVGEIGRGGMGVVYKARQIALDRVVALKMILDGSCAAAVELLRFRREAEAVARMRHPNLVPIFEVGEFEGRPYFSMEYVAGKGLDQEINRRPQPPRRAAALLETLARTADAIHRQGIIHRDFKPANILLEADGTPRVTDFGLAKELAAANSATRTGEIVGTPSYMAPEQATGRAWQIGPATDVYGLGTILYEMLTGRAPFDADTAWETIFQLVSLDPVPPRRICKAVPRDLERICLKCLAKSPDARYPSAKALADDLRRFLDGEPVEARPVGIVERTVKWARRRPALATLFAVSILAMVVVMIGHLVYSIRLGQAFGENQRRLVRLQVSQGEHALSDGDWIGALPWLAEAMQLDQDSPTRQRMHRLRLAAVLRQCPRLRQMWFLEKPVRHAEFSPDGRCLLAIVDGGAEQVWDVATGQSASRTWQHRELGEDVVVSPDGLRVVAFSDDGSASLCDAASGQAFDVALRHRGPVIDAAFSADGRRIATASDDQTAQIWDVSTGERLAPPLRHHSGVNTVAFSPDGAWIATGGDDNMARVWDSATGDPITPWLRHNGTVHRVAFSPDGHRLVSVGSDRIVRLWEIDSPGRAEPAGKRADAVQSSQEQGRWWSGDRRWFVVPAGDHAARVCDARTSMPLGAPLVHGNVVMFAAFSADNSRLVTASDDNAIRIWELSLGRNSAGAGVATNVVPPLHPTGTSLCAAFSADGQMVITAGADQTACVWDATTGEMLTPPLPFQGTAGEASFNSDGSTASVICSDGSVWKWDLQPDTRSAETWIALASVLSGCYIDPDRGLLPLDAETIQGIWKGL